MCHGCFEEYGSPAIFTDATREAARLIRETDGHSGYLHIVLDDWNLEDDHLEFCAGEIAKARAGFGDGRSSPDELAREWEIYETMRSMSLDERATAMAIADDYL
jgi:hypothetical protein